MITGDYDELNNLAKNSVCAEHHTPVVVAWHSGEKAWVLRCGHDHYPDQVTRLHSVTEMYKAGEELPGFIEDKVKKGMRRKSMTQGKQPTAVTMGGVPAVDLATGALLAPEWIKALVDYAHKYSLDPARGHVVLMYSKPYITIDGYLYHAFMSGTKYQLKSRPLTKLERKEHQIGLNDHAWTAEVVLEGAEKAFTGLGIVTQEEMEAKSSRDESKLRSPVVAAHPWQLAQKRAEWQVLRRAFPIGKPEETGNEAGD